MMWSIEDRTQKKEDITELVYTNPSTHEEELRIQVRTSDAKELHNILNKKQILHDVLDSEYTIYNNILESNHIKEIKESAYVYHEYLHHLKKRYKEAVTESEENGVLIIWI